MVQFQSQMTGLTIAPLTPPAHELEHPHPLYGQPHIQVQHGVLVKAPPCSSSHLTTLSHPGTPPDTPPVSASPPPLQLHRGERDPRDRGILLQLQQSGALVSDEVHMNGHMSWLTPTLREPLDLRPHCSSDQNPEAHPEPWPSQSHHHFQDLSHVPRHARHTGEFRSLNLNFFYFLGIKKNLFHDYDSG